MDPIKFEWNLGNLNSGSGYSNNNNSKNFMENEIITVWKNREEQRRQRRRNVRNFEQLLTHINLDGILSLSFQQFTFDNWKQAFWGIKAKCLERGFAAEPRQDEQDKAITDHWSHMSLQIVSFNQIKSCWKKTENYKAKV